MAGLWGCIWVSEAEQEGPQVSHGELESQDEPLGLCLKVMKKPSEELH